MSSSIETYPAMRLDPKSSTSRFEKINRVLQTIARYLLGITILMYGMPKLFHMQFQVSAWDYTIPLGQQSGTNLTWAFLGYAPWFQFLLGVLEAVPGLLLLFRRTCRLGALLLFPTLLNVVLMNFSMHLWRETVQIGCVLLILDVYLLSCDFPMYWSFLRRMLVKATPVRNARLRLAGNVLTAVIPLAAVGTVFYMLHAQVAATIMPISDFIGQHQINRSGTWSILQVDVAGQKVPIQIDSLLFFDFEGRCVFKLHTAVHSGYSYVSTSHIQVGRFKANRSARTFEISGVSFNANSTTIRGTYRVEGGQLLLQGEQQGQPVRIVLQKSNWGRT